MVQQEGEKGREDRLKKLVLQWSLGRHPPEACQDYLGWYTGKEQVEMLPMRQKLQIEQDKMKGSFDDDCVDLIIKEYRIRKAFMSKN